MAKTTTVAKVVKEKVSFVGEKDGVPVIKSKSYDFIIDEAGMVQLEKNLTLCCSSDNLDLFKSEKDNSLFVVCKSGKTSTPTVAYNGVSPFASKPDFVLYEGCDSVKKRYEPHMAAKTKAIDLITGDVHPSKTKVKASDADLIATLPQEKQAAILEYLEMKAALRKAARAEAKAATAETETPEADDQLADLAL